MTEYEAFAENHILDLQMALHFTKLYIQEKATFVILQGGSEYEDEIPYKNLEKAISECLAEGNTVEEIRAFAQIEVPFSLSIKIEGILG